jgi:hypothetical protein
MMNWAFAWVPFSFQRDYLEAARVKTTILRL